VGKVVTYAALIRSRAKNTRKGMARADDLQFSSIKAAAPISPFHLATSPFDS
jgi:hypothetical protein